MQVRRWRVRAPLLQLPFLFSCQAAPALISCTKESLPREKEREQELQRTGGGGEEREKKNVKTASTKSTNTCKDCFQKHSKGREWKRAGFGSLSSALKPTPATLNILKPLVVWWMIDQSHNSINRPDSTTFVHKNTSGSAAVGQRQQNRVRVWAQVVCQHQNGSEPLRFGVWVVWQVCLLSHCRCMPILNVLMSRSAIKGSPLGSVI